MTTQQRSPAHSEPIGTHPLIIDYHISTPYVSNNILQTAFQPREVAFFMDDIPDWETLAGQLDASIEVVRIDASKDGLEQMALWADVHHGYDAIRLFSHGSNGTLNL